MGPIRRTFVIAAALALLVSTRAAGQESARIQALGGENVSGVIPDLYTDLDLSPAYAFDAGRLTLWYTRKAGLSAYAFELPIAKLANSNLAYYMDSYNPSNELAVHGLRFGSWRTALAAEWTVNDRQSSKSRTSIYSISNIRVDSEFSRRDSDAWMFDAAAARALGGNHIIGLRFRASGYYQRGQGGRKSAYYYMPSNVVDLLMGQKANSIEESLHRRVAFDLQTSLARRDDAGVAGELAFSISLHRLYRFAHDYYYLANWDYDANGELTRYRADTDVWSDRREGDLWRFGASYRGTMCKDVRLFAGGGISTASYDAAYGDATKETYWDYGPILTDQLAESLEGKGDLIGGGAFAKAGRRFALHRTLDLFLGAHVSFDHTRSEEEPILRARFIADNEPVLGYEAVVGLTATSTRALIAVPVSIECRPSGWFSYFASFTPGASWRKSVAESPMNANFDYDVPFARTVRAAVRPAAGSPALIFDPAVTEQTVDESLDASHSIAFGFSFNYADRLFVDFYTGSAILPTSLSSVYGNIRYSF